MPTNQTKNQKFKLTFNKPVSVHVLHEGRIIRTNEVFQAKKIFFEKPSLGKFVLRPYIMLGRKKLPLSKFVSPFLVLHAQGFMKNHYKHAFTSVPMFCEWLYKQCEDHGCGNMANINVFSVSNESSLLCTLLDYSIEEVKSSVSKKALVK